MLMLHISSLCYAAHIIIDPNIQIQAPSRFARSAARALAATLWVDKAGDSLRGPSGSSPTGFKYYMGLRVPRVPLKGSIRVTIRDLHNNIGALIITCAMLGVPY